MVIRKRHVCSVLGQIHVQIAVAALMGTMGWSQNLSRVDRERAQEMLKIIAADVRQNYYDSKFHGVDWEATVRAADAEIAKATTLERATSEVAAALESLNDSHTIFMPPRYAVQVEYGWQFQMVGDRCFVTMVKPGSDAEAKGLKPGDEVVTIDGFAPSRGTMSRMHYALNVLSPQSVLHVGLVDTATKKFHNIYVKATVKRAEQAVLSVDLARMNQRLDAEERRDLSHPRVEEMGDALMIVKFPSFFQAEPEVEGLLDKACSHKALIVDLRGNVGGSEAVLRYWLGGLFHSDVKIADRVSRKRTEPVLAKSSRHHVFDGKLIVLVDSGSASAAEMFARVVQIGKRGTVLGDRTSGMTMEAKFFPHRIGTTAFQDNFLIFGAQITSAELVMTDGKSLEHVGVTPDETLLPSGADLAANRDPVLTRAAELAGVQLDPEKAGKLFPRRWAKDRAYILEE